jgi:hypothetical protein
MARNWISIINPPQNPPDWGIPPAQTTEFVALFNTAQYVLLQASSETERTPVVTAQCALAFKALAAKMRFLKNHYYLVPPLTDPDLISLGLKLPDTVHTPIPRPDGQVTADLAYPAAHMIEVVNIRALGAPCSDPRSEDGVDIHLGIVGGVGPYAIEAPPDPERGGKLPFAKTTRRRRERFNLEGNSGKTVWVSLAYRNGKNQVGPFCPAFSAIVP